MGIATRIAVRLTPDPPRVAHDAVRVRRRSTPRPRPSAAIIAAGVLPAALEMMDARITAAVEDFVGAGYPRDAEAVLLVEVDGLRRRGRRARRSRSTAIAPGERRDAACASRPTTPSARCCGRAASRRSARSPASRPTTTCTTRSCPRTKLVEVLRQVYEIADAHDLIVMNVFHAGDGNLHPLLVFDGREPGVWERVHAAGTEILETCLDAGRRAHRRARRRASRSATSCRSCSRPTTSTRRRGCATRSIPTAPPTRRRCCRAGAAAASCSACPEGAWI